MGVIIPQVVSEDRASGAPIIDGGLRFDENKSQYLTRTPSSAGNRRTWTWSCWCKIAKLPASGTNGDRVLFSAVDAQTNGDDDSIRFLRTDATGANSLYWNSSEYNVGAEEVIYTNAVLRDPNAFYHVVLIKDTTQSSLANGQMKMYINGVEQSLVESNAISQNAERAINSTVPHAIGDHYGQNRQWDGLMSQVYFIDGQALGPEYFGYTDPLTNTWRPKKFKPQATPNDGTVWSSNSTGVANDGTSAPANAFDGNLSTQVYTSGGANSELYYDIPNLKVNSTVRVFIEQHSETNVSFYVIDTNDVKYEYLTAAPYARKWVDITGVAGKTIKRIGAKRNSNGHGTAHFAWEIDGVILLDGDTTNMGKNAFYLPFDGSAPIGQDQSGRGNDWTPVNFGGSNTIEKATGALPILNTDGGGKVARVGVRTDANASNLVLALPLVGIASDVSASIRGTGSNKTVTTNSIEFLSTQSNFYGGSAFWSAQTDHVTLDGSSDFAFGTGDFTIECWLYPTGGFTLYDSRPTGTQGAYITWGFNSGTDFALRVNDTDVYTKSGAIALNTWSHVALVRKSGITQLYVNGVAISNSYTDNNNYINGANRPTLAGGVEASPNYAITGYKQDFRVYKGVAKYTSNFIPASTDPDIVPDSPSGVSYSSNVTQIVDGAVAFDGSGDYLSIPNSNDFIPGTNDFTIEGFFYLSAHSTGTTTNLYGINNGGGSNPKITVYVDPDGTLHFDFTTAGGASLITSSSGTITTGVWYHIAFVRNSGVFNGYVNGSSVGSSSASINLTGLTQPFYIGYIGESYGTTLNGFVSNFNFVNGAALYTSNFTPPSAPLTAVENTKLLCCQENKFPVVGYTTSTASGALPILNTDPTGITATGGVASDSNASSLSLALPMNGSNNGTTFTDQSPTGRTSSIKSFTVTGNAKTVTSQYKFYGSSASFDGSGDELSVASSSDFAIKQDDFTIEMWVYPNNAKTLLSLGTGGTSLYWVVALLSNSSFGFGSGSGAWGWENGGPPGSLASPSGVVPPGTWTHIAIQRSGNSLVYYANGVLVYNNPSAPFGSATHGGTLYIGSYFSDYNNDGSWFNGYISDLRIYKGVAKYTSNFNPVGDFERPSALVSPSQIYKFDSASATNFNPFTDDIDTQRGKQSGWCTWNPLNAENPNTLTNGNLNSAGTGSGGERFSYGTVAVASGKWYYELTIGTGSVNSHIGAADPSGKSNFYISYQMQGNLYYESGLLTSSWGSSFTNGDVVAIAVDNDNGAVYFSKNGVWQGGGNPTSGSSKTGAARTFTPRNLCPLHITYNSTNVDSANFGQKPFKFPPPAGFQPLTLANLPRPTIVRPDQYVGIVTYTGTSASTATITSDDIKFTPDFVWVKSRSNAESHALYDTVRGATYRLRSDATNAENTGANELQSFIPGGFTSGNNGHIYYDSYTYAAWCWKAGGNSNTFNIDDVGYDTAEAAGLTAGTITPTGASVNTKSGFSIVKFDSNSTGGTVPHGLGSSPKFIICKNRDYTSNWPVYHIGLAQGPSGNNTLILDDSLTAYNSNYLTDAVPTTNVFSHKGFGSTSTASYIAYCWAEIPGFSKFGIYNGNSNNDGSFVELGFRPAVILIKRYDGAGNWILVDKERNKFNPVDKQLLPNDPMGDYTEAAIDFVSNGFKMRLGSSGHVNIYSYIYAAFAEAPTFNLYGAQSNAR